MWWLPALLACGTPAQSTEPAPEPEPTEAPAPAPAAEAVKILIGAQCEEPKEGEPADQAAFEAMLKEASLDVQGIEAMPVCEACGGCPRLAFEVKTSQPDEVKALFPSVDPRPAAKVKISVGRKCQDPVADAPTTAEGVVEALKEVGVEVMAHEVMMVCQACGCPELALMIDVPPGHEVKAASTAKPWTPKAKENKLKGSLP